jgi:hypothetical protein
VVVLLAIPSLARAGALDVYGFGARATSMGGAQTVRADGAAALFYNVGALSDVRPKVMVSTVVTTNQSEILLHPRPDGYDIPDLGGDSPAVSTGRTLHSRRDTTNVPGYQGLVISGVTSLGLEGFRMGAFLSVPFTGFLDLGTHFVDERERLYSNRLHYELTGRSTRRMDAGFGAAYRVLPWLSVGLGAMYVPGAEPSTDVFVEDLSNLSNVGLNADIPTTDGWGLLAGVNIDILPTLQLGLSYRGELMFRVTGENRIRLGTENPTERTVVQTIDWTPSYSPETVAGGIGWQIGDVALQGDVKFRRWSNYRNTQHRPADFHDTWSPHLGAEYDFSETTNVRVGAGWEPTPVPPQRGRTNYVGNHRILASLGAGHRFDLWGEPVELDWALQLQALPIRRVDKRRLETHPDCGSEVTVVCDEVPDDTTDSRTGQPYPEARGLQTGNPGFPGYTSGGWIGGFYLDVAWLPENGGDDA